MTSKGHVDRAKQLFSLDLLTGSTEHKRLFVGYRPPGVLTKEGLAAWWGSDIEMLPVRLQEKLSTTTVEVKVGKTKIIQVTGDEISSYSLGIVNFAAGAAKYSESQFIDWSCIPLAEGDVIATDHMAQEHGEHQLFWPVVRIGLRLNEKTSKACWAETGFDAKWQQADARCEIKAVWCVCVYQVLLKNPQAWLANFAQWAPLSIEDASSSQQ